MGNGFNSTGEKAQLFILDASDGSIIKRFDTLTGSPANTNGMSEPLVLDTNGDRIIDFIYAGDLLGNLWKIDVSSTSASAWDFAFTSAGNPVPFYTAVEPDGITPQAITVKPSIALHPNGGFILLFGTGKFLETSDNILTGTIPTNTFYGLRDNGALIPAGRNNLQVQTVSAVPGNPAARTITTNIVDYTSDQGWFIDFNIASGERIIADAFALSDTVVFFHFYTRC